MLTRGLLTGGRGQKGGRQRHDVLLGRPRLHPQANELVHAQRRAAPQEAEEGLVRQPLQHLQHSPRHAAPHQLQHRLAPVRLAAQEPTALCIRHGVRHGVHRIHGVHGVLLRQQMVGRLVRRLQQDEHAARGRLAHAPRAADHLLVLGARVALLPAVDPVQQHHRHVQVHTRGEGRGGSERAHAATAEQPLGQQALLVGEPGVVVDDPPAEKADKRGVEARGLLP